MPIVVTGFEPVDLLEGVWMTVRQLEEGRAEVRVFESRDTGRGRAGERAAAPEGETPS